MSDALPLLGKEDSWRKRNVHLFRSDEGARWFLREHRDELVDAGVIVMIAGRWLVVDAQKMTDAVIEIGRADAIRLREKDDEVTDSA